MTVYLFKGRSSNQEDEYESQLQSHGYQVKFIPTLFYSTESVKQLAELIAAGPGNQHIGGVVFCSQRAVETWSEANRVAMSTTMTAETTAAWRRIPALVVGPKTAEQLERLEFFSDRAQWIVANRASDLADKIQSTQQQQQQQHKQQLLFLAGDKRRDELPMRMADMNIPMKEIRAYATCAHPDLSGALKELEEQFGTNDWVVFFSPSGVKYVQQITTSLFKDTKIAAIGPTTADYISSQQYPVHATAEQPKPEYLADAIVKYDAKNKNE